MCNENLAIIVLQSIALFFSEILPFLKGKQNGLAHAVYNILQSECVKPAPTVEMITEITLQGELRETPAEPWQQSV